MQHGKSKEENAPFGLGSLFSFTVEAIIYSSTSLMEEKYI